MPGRYFLDTNILVYSFDKSDPRKQALAQDLIRSALANDGCLSWQVVQEFCNVALGKMKVAFSADQLESYQKLVLVPLCRLYPDARLFGEALQVARATGYSWYDSLVIASAQRLGCATLYSEDLQHGQVLAGGLEIRNPFL